MQNCKCGRGIRYTARRQKSYESQYGSLICNNEIIKAAIESVDVAVCVCVCVCVCAVDVPAVQLGSNYLQHTPTVPPAKAEGYSTCTHSVGCAEQSTPQ